MPTSQPDIQIGHVTDGANTYAVSIAPQALNLLVQMARGEKFNAVQAATASVKTTVRLTRVSE